MNRNFVIGLKGHSQEVLACGCTDNEAFEIATNSTGFDSIDVYINAVPFSSFNGLKKKAKKTAKKKAVKS